MNNQYFEVDGVRYRWEGGLGCQFKSEDRSSKTGDVRYIKNELFYVFAVYDTGLFKKNTVCWCAVRNVKCDDVSKMKSSFFL